MLVGGLLPTEDKEEGEVAEEGGPAISRLLLELAGDLPVEDAQKQGRFRLARNPEPRGHPSHLAAAAAAFRRYYTNDRSGFGEPSYLLSIGSSTGSTTQFDVRISHDEVPVLLIMPRHPSKLQEMLDDSLGVSDCRSRARHAQVVDGWAAACILAISPLRGRWRAPTGPTYHSVFRLPACHAQVNNFFTAARVLSLPQNMIQAVSAVVEEGKKEEDALYDDDFTQNAGGMRKDTCMLQLSNQGWAACCLCIFGICWHHQAAMTVAPLLSNTTSTAAALFKLLSGVDVLEACGCTEGVLAVLQGLTADSKRQGGLLRAPLAAMKEALVPLLLEGVLCGSGDERFLVQQGLLFHTRLKCSIPIHHDPAGAQENLSSDIWFLRENIGDPVGALLRAAGMSLPELPDDLDGDEGRTLQGLLVEYVHATVSNAGAMWLAQNTAPAMACGSTHALGTPCFLAGACPRPGVSDAGRQAGPQR